MTTRTLVAGIGNIFNGDDGFGSEVAQRLVALPARDGVRVEDYGIRGVHLAYELLEGYDLLVLIDAFGYRLSRITGSHHIYEHPRFPLVLNLPPESDGKAKEYRRRV